VLDRASNISRFFTFSLSRLIKPFIDKGFVTGAVATVSEIVSFEPMKLLFCLNLLKSLRLAHYTLTAWCPSGARSGLHL